MTLTVKTRFVTRHYFILCFGNKISFDDYIDGLVFLNLFYKALLVPRWMGRKYIDFNGTLIE